MSLVRPILVFAGIWTTVHVVHYCLNSSRDQPLLPSSRPSRRRNSSGTSVILNKFHLRIQTSSWNSLHDVLTNRFARRRTLRKIIINFYNVGSIMGVLGMLGATVLMIWTCYQTAMLLLKSSAPPAPIEAPLLVKRGLDTTSSLSSETFVRPIVSPLHLLST